MPWPRMGRTSPSPSSSEIVALTVMWCMPLASARSAAGQLRPGRVVAVADGLA